MKQNVTMMNKSKIGVVISIVLFTLALTACTPVLSESTINDKQTNFPTTLTSTIIPTTTNYPLTSVTPKIPPIITSTTPTPLSAQELACPELGGQPHLVFPTSINSLQPTILNYLNTGGDPITLPKLLTDLETPGETEIFLDLTSIDFNVDGSNELIALGELWVNNESYHESVVWVFGCSAGKYQYIGDFGGGYYSWNPKIISTKDLNADNKPEAIIHNTWAGSGCSEDYGVLGWKNGLVTDYLDPQNNIFECRTTISTDDRDNDGKKELVFTGETDPGYGYPGRSFIYIYKFDNARNYQRVSEEFLPSPYRIYALEDAQKAFDSGDFIKAVEFYDKAAHDDALLDLDSYPYVYQNIVSESGGWPKDLAKKDSPKEYITSFSLFRLVAIYLYLQDNEKAVSVLSELEERFPIGTDGSEFVDLSHQIQQFFEQGVTPVSACQSITTTIENQYPLLEWHYDWGTAISYSNKLICPFVH